MKNNHPHIAVIGAGIAGLSAAYWLCKEGFRVSVFEKSAKPGGAITTTHMSDCIIETGPNTTLETSETLRNLIEEIGLGSQRQYARPEAKNRFIVRNGKLHPVPSSPLSFIKSGLFSIKAKVRLLKEPFIRKTSNPDISLADFVEYRLGREFLDYAINPFVAGVYAGDPAHLSTAAGFPKLFQLEQKYGSLIRGALLGARERRKRKEVAKNKATMFTFKEGMESFPSTLADKIGHSLELNTEVLSISKADAGFAVNLLKNDKEETRIFQGVIAAVPTFVMDRLLSFIPAQTKQQLNNVSYPPVNVVYMAYPKEAIEHKLDGFGFLVPEKENRKILGTLWNTSIFTDRAPEGMAGLTTFIGGSRQPELTALSEEETFDMVHGELSELLNIQGQPKVKYLRRWPRAIPQYHLDYPRLQQNMKSAEKENPGLFFAGNTVSGISVGDAVLSAREVCNRVTEYYHSQDKSVNI